MNLIEIIFRGVVIGAVFALGWYLVVYGIEYVRTLIQIRRFKE